MLDRIFSQSVFNSLCGLLLFCILFLVACHQSEPTDSESTSPTPSPKTPSTHSLASSSQWIELLFLYDREKQAWLNEVTEQFNAAQYQLSDNQIIQVKAVPMNSWTIIDEVLSEKRQPHLISPVSNLFIQLGNLQSQLKVKRDLVGYTENLVLSPLVIALWKPMAEALGWGKQPISWNDILAVAQNPKGWAAYNYPEGGRFKLGYPHPKYSASGLLSLLAQVYAATHKSSQLTKADINQTTVRNYLQKLQKTVVYYGYSNQFLAQELITQGPSHLSAALLYENRVIQSYQQNHLPVPLVSIYPKEGTFWSEHPISIVERDWVSPAHREAAHNYMSYLLEKRQQKKALQYGFRPANDRLALTAPIDAAHGVDPSSPKVTLQIPSIHVVETILKLWPQYQKPAQVLFMLDISGSMRDDKILHARNTALKLLNLLKDNDSFSFVSFNHHVNWVAENVPIGQQQERLRRQIKYQFVGGGTALYDAIEQAYTFLLNNPQPDKISTVVIFSDGLDSHSQLSLQRLLSQIPYHTEERPIRIFTVNYGKNQEQNPLHEIAQVGHGQFYQGNGSGIDNLLKDLALFF